MIGGIAIQYDGVRVVTERERELLDGLRRWIRKAGPLAVAWSGGVDSTLLVAVGRQELGDDLIALHAHTPLHTDEELRHVEDLAERLGVAVEIVRADPYQWPEFIANPTDRCYHCKRRLYGRFVELVHRRGVGMLADGTNADDLEDDRPGLRALEEFGVRTPLAELGLTKAVVRRLSRFLDLPTWDRPSNSCLATRVPAGLPIEPVTIERIRRAEAVLTEHGWIGSRVRLTGERAMIEVPTPMVESLWNTLRQGGLISALREVGVESVYVDYRGRP